jgi:hypothetical protein
MPITLTEIERALSAEDFETHLAPASDDLPVPQLLAHLGQDQQNRDLFAQVLFIGDLADSRGAAPLEGDDYLQVYSAFPFAARPESVADLARLILMLNRDLPVSFGLTEDDGAVFCRHVIVCPGRALNIAAAVEAVDLMGYFMGVYGPALEAVARGEKSLAQVLADVAEGIETHD